MVDHDHLVFHAFYPRAPGVQRHGPSESRAGDRGVGWTVRVRDRLVGFRAVLQCGEPFVAVAYWKIRKDVGVGGSFGQLVWVHRHAWTLGAFHADDVYVYTV